MAEIKINLLDSKRTVATYKDISIDNPQSYQIIAGEKDTTTFRIVYNSETYKGYTFSVEMVNSLGYGIAAQPIVNDTFVLPVGMATAGYGHIGISASNGTEVIHWLPVKVKVWNYLTEWKQAIAEKEYITPEQFNGLVGRVEDLEQNGTGGGSGGAVSSVNGQTGNVNTYKGWYNSSTRYYVGDMVMHEDNLYLCVEDNIGYDPIETAYELWLPITHEQTQVMLNGYTTTYPQFYAPTTAGTSGYVLTSTGKSGQPPVWKAPTSSGGGSSENLSAYHIFITAEKTYIAFVLYAKAGKAINQYNICSILKGTYGENKLVASGCYQIGTEDTPIVAVKGLGAGNMYFYRGTGVMHEFYDNYITNFECYEVPLNIEMSEAVE